MSMTGKIDPSTLGWVKTEIDESLKQARLALESFAENPSDTTHLRFCITHLHQVVGTLEMVELSGAALLARETEGLTQAMLDENVKAEGAIFDVLTRGILTLPDYLGRLQFGQPDMPLRLLPVINELRAARSQEPLDELELFEPDLSVRPPRGEKDSPRLSEEEYLARAKKLRPTYQSALLKWLRDNSNQESLATMTQIVEQLKEGAPLGVLEQLFWVAGGLLEAVSTGALEVSSDVKKLFARLEQQLKKLIDGTDKSLFRNTSESLIKAVLLTLGRLQTDSPTVTQLKRAFQLDSMMADATVDTSDTEIDELPSPEVIQSVSAAMAKEIEAAQDLLSAYFDPDEHDVSSFEQLPGLLHKMSSTVEMLGIPVIKNLVDELAAVCRAVTEKQIEVSDTVSMSMARALLLLETSLHELHIPQGAWKKQMEESVAALRRLHSPDAEDVPALEGIEVSEAELTDTEFKQLLSAVAGEIRVNLTKIEEALEMFAGSTDQPEQLEPLPQYLSQIEGALQILGQDATAELAAATSANIQRLLNRELPPGSRVLDSLAVAIGTIGAYVEGLQSNRSNMDSLVETALTEMDAVVKESGGAAAAPESPVAGLKKSLGVWLETLDAGVLLQMQQTLKELAQSAGGEGQSRIEKISEQMNNLLDIVRDDPAQLSDDIIDMLQASLGTLAALSGSKDVDVPAPRPLPREEVSETVVIRKEAAARPPAETESAPEPEPEFEPAEPATAPGKTAAISEDEDFDLEIMQIFVEDAKEVLENIRRDFASWKNDPGNQDVLVELRRAFHTLKGSGRMVGASEIAELAWAMENLLNKIREGKASCSESVFDLIEQVKNVLPDMIHQLEGGPEVSTDIDAMRKQAEDLARGVVPAPTVTEKEDKQERGGGDKPGVDATLLNIFTNEARGHLAIIRQEIERCRETGEGCLPSSSLLRSVHTLQGNARSLSIRTMSEACGEMEKMLHHMAAEEIKLDDVHLDLLSRIEESVSSMVEAMNQDDGAPDGFAQQFGNLAALISREAGRLPATDKENKKRKPEAKENKPAQTGKVTSAEGEPEKAPAAPVEDTRKPVSTQPGAITPAIAKADNISDPELLEIFLEEAVDILNVIEESVTAWRRNDGNSDAVQNMKRALHTLKGGARMAGAMIMGDLAHATETMIKQLEDRNVSPDGDVFDLLEEIHDTLVTMTDRLQGGQPAPELVHISNKIAAVISGGSPGESRAAPASSAQDRAPPSEAVADEPPSGAADPHEASDDGDPAEIVRSGEAEPAADLSEDQPPPRDAAGDEIRFDEGETRMEPFADTVFLDDRKDRREQIKVQTRLLNELSNYAGEVSISRARMEQQIFGFRENLSELHRNVTRFRDQIRELEIQSESQILYRAETETVMSAEFDPLELDRYSKLQQLSRSLNESLHDLATIQMSLHTFVGEAETVLLQQARINTDLQEGLMRTRMIDFSSQSARLRHIVRQTARELGKRAELLITGTEVEVDRNVMERMIGPFEHMIRNAIDHGIESEEERKRAGKPSAGRITIDTSQEGSEIVIRFSDDGAGLDVDGIRQSAIERNLITDDAGLSDEEVMQFILLPGFSTAKEITHFSGRGVGMDVVHNEVKQLGGSMSVETRKGLGTTFIIHLPLTLSITQALLVHVGDQVFAIPLSAVLNIIEVAREQLEEMAGEKKPLLNYEDHVYPFMSLSSRLLIPAQHRNGRKVPVLLAKAGQRDVAIQVDGLAGTREIVVKSVGPQLSEVKGLAGATVFGDGRVVLILDIPGLWFTDEAMHLVQPVKPKQEEEKPLRPVVMVVDDSLTVRKVTSRHLQKRGIDVMVAKDGIDAIEQLRERVPDVMLVDIEMPRMDGYELTARVRATSNLKHIPIIMITSRAGAKHRARAMELGVNVYMSKPYQEEDLLANIESFLGNRTIQ